MLFVTYYAYLYSFCPSSQGTSLPSVSCAPLRMLCIETAVAFVQPTRYSLNNRVYTCCPLSHTIKMLALRLPIAIALLLSAAARKITFPPPIGLMDQRILGHGGNIDVTSGPAFAGLTTYANLPYVHCLAGDDEVEKYDIAILGAPFDTVSTWFLDLPTVLEFGCGLFKLRDRYMPKWGTKRQGAHLCVASQQYATMSYLCAANKTIQMLCWYRIYVIVWQFYT